MATRKRGKVIVCRGKGRGGPWALLWPRDQWQALTEEEPRAVAEKQRRLMAKAG